MVSSPAACRTAVGSSRPQVGAWAANDPCAFSSLRRPFSEATLVRGIEPEPRVSVICRASAVHGGGRGIRMSRANQPCVGPSLARLPRRRPQPNRSNSRGITTSAMRRLVSAAQTPSLPPSTSKTSPGACPVASEHINATPTMHTEPWQRPPVALVRLPNPVDRVGRHASLKSGGNLCRRHLLADAHHLSISRIDRSLRDSRGRSV